MRKNFLFLLIFFLMFQSHLFADEWDDIGGLDNAWDGQKVVTDKEFEQVMDKLNEKKEKQEQKKRKKLIKKISGGGTSLHKELNHDAEIKDNVKFKSEEDGILLNIPVDFLINGKVLEKGYYKLIPEKEEGKGVYVHFYQSQYLKATLKVDETDDDFGKETIDFAEIVPYNESFVKFIFGSLSFNAFAFIQMVND